MTLEELTDVIRKAFPAASVTVDPSLYPDGIHHVDVRLGRDLVTVEMHREPAPAVDARDELLKAVADTLRNVGAPGTSVERYGLVPALKAVVAALHQAQKELRALPPHSARHTVVAEYVCPEHGIFVAAFPLVYAPADAICGSHTGMFCGKKSPRA